MNDEEIIQQEITAFLNSLLAKIQITPENVRTLRSRLQDTVDYVIGQP
jgi:hypothetical protein